MRNKGKISTRQILKSSDNDELEVKKDFAYLNLLDDNSPRNFSEYNAEAQILKTQIDNPNTYNIAVVAKYGAGKSSVINTYLHNYRRTKEEKKKNVVLGKPEKNRYTRITLSTFNKSTIMKQRLKGVFCNNFYIAERKANCQIQRSKERIRLPYGILC